LTPNPSFLVSHQSPHPPAGALTPSHTLTPAPTDGVQRHLIGEIIRRFEKKGFKLVGMKLMQVWQGLDVVKMARTMIRETNPSDSRPGTIRGDFSIEVSKNVIHGSDSIESARREILLWFHTDKLTCWAESTEPWIYE
uniref:Nucleoside diphosphate kinase n=1 Tax=Gopherus agassizii TaxID=38772 RepID=A0A452IYN3_9SAUR